MKSSNSSTWAQKLDLPYGRWSPASSSSSEKISSSPLRSLAGSSTPRWPRLRRLNLDLSICQHHPPAPEMASSYLCLRFRPLAKLLANEFEVFFVEALLLVAVAMLPFSFHDGSFFAS